MAHIFISYSHKDKAYVSKLYEALTARGFDAWIDDRIDYGSEWPREIERRLDACDALVLVMTPQAHGSEWVHNELSRAQRLRKPVFPLLLEGEGPWLSVEAKQYVDVRGKRLPPEDFYDRLEKVAPRSRTLPRAGAPAAAQARLVPQPRPEKPKPTKEELASRERQRNRASSRIKPLAIGALAVAVIALITWGVIALGPQITGYFSSPLSTTPMINGAPEPTKTPNAIAQEIISRTRAIDGMVEVYVPAGSSDMGSTSGARDEAPVHRVTLSAFWIDQTEVTNRMFALCVQAGACKSPVRATSRTRTSYYGNTAYDDYPVIYVSWPMANAYCAWAGGSLPSEAQWEYAARGSDGRAYPWGSDSPTCSLAHSGCESDTAAVGSYPDGASPFGVMDMAGNVWEWVNDWYETYPSEAQNNPSGPNDGEYRVVRGGSWDSLVGSTLRYPLTSSAFDTIGFRCVRPAAP